MKSRKAVVIVAIISILIFSALAGASSPVKTAWILLPETAIYGQASFESEVLYTCNQNENVVLDGDSFVGSDEVVWQKVIYNDTIEGYLPYNLLYFTNNSTTEEVRLVKITPDKMGVDVPIYKVLTDEPSMYLSDGTQVTLLETSADYGEYSLIAYQGQNFFVKTQNITDTMTFNQKVAVIIAAVVIGLVISIISIILIYRKRTLNK